MNFSQNYLVMNHLATHRTITSLEAVYELGCLCLPKRISELIQLGAVIEKTWIKVPSGKRVVQYSAKMNNANKRVMKIVKGDSRAKKGTAPSS